MYLKYLSSQVKTMGKTRILLCSLTLPVREAMDGGAAKQLFDEHPAIAKIYTDAAFQIALTIADKGKDFSSRFPKIVVE